MSREYRRPRRSQTGRMGSHWRTSRLETSIEAAYEPEGDWGFGVRERYAEVRKSFYGV